MKKKQKGKRLRKSKIQDQDLEPKAIQEMKNKKEDKKDKNDKTKKNKKIKKGIDKTGNILYTNQR